MKLIAYIFVCTSLLNSCVARMDEDVSYLAPYMQDSLRIGGCCDGCDLMYVGVPDEVTPIDTSSFWDNCKQRLVIRGTVFQRDGNTPAQGILIYYWQTDDTGQYHSSRDADPQIHRHGSIRGWMRSDEEGKYALYTGRPAPYPGQNTPAHIHILVREPSLPNEYYIDEIVFDNDPHLTSENRRALENRGGSGILVPVRRGGVLHAERNIILGLNIPGYNQSKASR